MHRFFPENVPWKFSYPNLLIVGCGIHPDWDKNENCPVAFPRYRMLMDYLNLSRNVTKSDLHHFPEYGAFICGSQVQLDVSKSNYLRVINAFTQIEAAKAYLFPKLWVFGSRLGYENFKGHFLGRLDAWYLIQRTSVSIARLFKELRMIFLTI